MLRSYPRVFCVRANKLKFQNDVSIMPTSLKLHRAKKINTRVCSKVDVDKKIQSENPILMDRRLLDKIGTSYKMLYNSHITHRVF